MATLTSVNALKTSIAAAERQVQRDQSQVQQDSARLDQSQAQLARDQQRLNGVQEQGRTASASSETPAKASAPRLERAIQTQAGKIQVNTQGQTIGTLINTQA